MIPGTSICLAFCPNPSRCCPSYFVPDHTVPYGTVLSRDGFPGTSCQATIGVVPPGRAGRHFATASRHLAKACCELSRRDGAIVAWHEVPGKTPPKRAVP